MAKCLLFYFSRLLRLSVVAHLEARVILCSIGDLNTISHRVKIPKFYIIATKNTFQVKLYLTRSTLIVVLTLSLTETEIFRKHRLIMLSVL